MTFARTRRRPRKLTSRLARSYDARGFAIKGAYCVGSVFAYDGAHARRGRRDARDITPETLAALEIVDPTPDLLIVGTGRAMCPLREDTLRYLKEIGVAVDACDRYTREHLQRSRRGGTMRGGGVITGRSRGSG